MDPDRLKVQGASPVRHRSIAAIVSATLVFCLGGALISRDYAETPGIAALIVAFLIAVAAISPAGALGATVLALPTAYKLYPFPAGSFSLLEVSILALSAGLGLGLLVSGRASVLRAWHSLTGPVSISLPAFAIIPAAALAFVMLPDGAHPDVALREIRVTIVEPLLLFAAALVVMRDHRARAWTWTCAAAIGTMLGVGAIIQVTGGFGGVETGTVSRATGIYSHPNNLALFLERSLLLSLPMISFRPRHPVLLLAIGAQAVGLGLTYSRGALLALGVGVAVWLLLLGMRRRLVIASGVALLVGAVLYVTTRERLFDLGGSGSEPTRFAIWRSSMRMLVDNPVFGVGPDQFLYQYGLRYIEPSAWAERYTSHPHNIVLDIWLRLGAAGIGTFAALVLGIGATVGRMRHRLRNDAISCGAIAALSGGVAHGLVDNGFFLPDLAGITWIGIAMIVTVDPIAAPRAGADGD